MILNRRLRNYKMEEETVCVEDSCAISSSEPYDFRMALPETLDELLEPTPPREIVAIIKRKDKMPVPFDKQAIFSAIIKASRASGRNYSPQEAEERVDAVVSKLRDQARFKHSGITIPHVEDVQDAVLQVFEENNAREISEEISSNLNLSYDVVFPLVEGSIKKGKLDPTGEFYKRYSTMRGEVREKLVSLPTEVSFDATDKQLQINTVSNGRMHKFDAEGLFRFILDKTKAKYDDANAVVKRVEEVLANRRGTKPVEKEELLSIIDSSLMERGYSKEEVISGENLSITFADVDQLIINRSVENSNIKSNNPEAVNLGIAELVLKELALRTVFGKNIALAHKEGRIHIHDLGYPDRVYCSAHSVEYIKMFGLDKIVANLDAKSTPAKNPFVLNNHIHTFLAAIQSSYAGALGFPMLNTLYGPALLKEIEMVDGIEIIKDVEGKEIYKAKKRLRRSTLEHRLDDGDLQEGDFQETGSVKILSDLGKNEMKHYIRGLVKELKQSTQNLIFGASQSAYSRGGQTLFIDFNVDLATPEYVTEVPALFLGARYKRVIQNEKGEWEMVETVKEEPSRYKGVMVDKGHKDAEGKPILETANKNGDVIHPEDGTKWVTYGHDLVRKASAKFAEAIFEVSAEGDKYGNMFNFPKIDVHVGRETFENPEADALLRKACEAVEKNDSIYFMFDRGDGMNVSQCCRLRERITDPEILKHPEKMRFCGFQNVSLNLPQATYRAKGNNIEEKLQSSLKEIDEIMLLGLKAHTDKRKYIQYLFDTEGSPMRTMGGVNSDDGTPYIDLAKSTYILGIVGLNEAVQNITGRQMHEDAESYKVGLRILSHMHSVKTEFTRRYGMKFVIEETPGESANRRLAKLDLIKFPEEARKVLKGSFERDEIYYTNSSHLTADAPVSGLDRTILQSKMDPMIEAGAITHIFSGEKANKTNAVYDFVKSTFYNTQSSQIVFSGEHTVCLSCGDHSRGLKDKCGKCGNEDPKLISQKTRVVGYFSDPRIWNKSKQGELRARQASKQYYAGESQSTIDLEAELLKQSIEQGKIRVAVIGSKGCSICEEAMNRVKRVIENEKYLPKNLAEKVEIVKYDVGTEDGRVMAAIYDAPLDTYPTIVVHKGDRFVRKGWQFPYNKPAIGLSTPDIGEMVASIASGE
jgi:anaerobic ribonucleoside-triphosphate reductase